LIAHEAINGHSFQAQDLTVYCQCEIEFFKVKATQDQLDEFKKYINSNGLKKLKSNALSICVEKGHGITT
jgi:hypothetical protein